VADIYELELPAEPVGVEVSAGQTDLKLTRWDGECSMRIALPTLGRPTVSYDRLRTSLVTDRFDVNLYPLQPDIQRSHGGIEFEVVLKERPPVNQVVLGLDLDGLDAHYQPPLTAEEIARGDERPDNVIGSYAIYHSTKRGLMRRGAQGEKYKTGKAFHIYRPLAIDTRGNKTWCDLAIGQGLMTINVPQPFLDTAFYPVLIDPEFGYHNDGSTGASIINIYRAVQHTCPEDNVIGVSIVAQMRSDGAQKKKCGLYQPGDGWTDFVTNGGTEEKTDIYAQSWRTFNFLTAPELMNQAYKLTAWGESGSTLVVYYDTVAITGYYREVTYGAWPDPGYFLTIANVQLSIYCIYDYPAIPPGGGSSPAAKLIANALI